MPEPGFNDADPQPQEHGSLRQEDKRRRSWLLLPPILLFIILFAQVCSWLGTIGLVPRQVSASGESLLSADYGPWGDIKPIELDLPRLATAAAQGESVWVPIDAPLAEPFSQAGVQAGSGSPSPSPPLLSTNTLLPINTSVQVDPGLPTSTPAPLDPSLPTNTPVPVAPGLPTNTSVPLPTNTPMPLPTNTSVPPPTSTPSLTATNSPVPTATNTSVPTATNTPVPTASATPIPPTSTSIPATLSSSLYLHNDPSPPGGNTSSHSILPMNSSAASAGSLFNYDTDRDSFAGLLIQKGGSGFNESDPVKHQRWRSAVFAENNMVNGAPQLVFWSAMKNFQQGKGGTVAAHMAATNGTTTAWSISGSVQSADWQGGSGSWLQKILTFSTPNPLMIPAGYWLELVLVVTASAEDDMWFAYDTAAYPTTVMWP